MRSTRCSASGSVLVAPLALRPVPFAATEQAMLLHLVGEQPALLRRQDRVSFFIVSTSRGPRSGRTAEVKASMSAPENASPRNASASASLARRVTLTPALGTIALEQLHDLPMLIVAAVEFVAQRSARPPSRWRPRKPSISASSSGSASATSSGCAVVVGSAVVARGAKGDGGEQNLRSYHRGSRLRAVGRRLCQRRPRRRKRGENPSKGGPGFRTVVTPSPRRCVPRIVAFFREQFWMVQVAGLAIVAALAGSAAMTVARDVAVGRRPDPAVARRRRRGCRRGRGRGRREPRRGWRRRGPRPRPTSWPATCSARPAFGRGGAREAGLLAEAPVAMPSDLPLRLMATMEADAPAHSLATLHHATTGRPGSTLQGVVLVRRDARRRRPRRRDAPVPATARSCSAWGSGPSLRPKPRLKPKPKAKKAKKSSSSFPGADEAIRCSGNTCDVEREFVESLLRNPAALASQAAVRPTSNGFALSRVRRARCRTCSACAQATS